MKRSRSGRFGGETAGETMGLHRTEFATGPDGQLVRVLCVGVSPFVDGIRDVVAQLKYSHEKSNARVLANVLAQHVAHDLPYDIVTWIPTLTSRRLERGFDHAELIARHFGAMVGRPTRAVLRRTSDGHQTGRTRSERLVGVNFVASPSVRRKAVCVVDDVITTGTTMREAAQALARRGATEILCLGPAFVQ